MNLLYNNSDLCIGHYHDLLTVPRDSSIDWNIDNAWAALSRRVHFQFWSQFAMLVYI